MNTPARALSSRRDILKGGALIVGFNIAENIRSSLAQSLLEPPTLAIGARPDPEMLDSWIAIHADNTATVFMGKVELGQGTTTGMLQIAGYLGAGHGHALDARVAQLKQDRFTRYFADHLGNPRQRMLSLLSICSFASEV